MLSSAIFNDDPLSCYFCEDKRIESIFTSQTDGLLCTWQPNFEEYLKHKEGYCLTPRRIVSPIGQHPREVRLENILALRVDYVQSTAYLTGHNEINEFWEMEGSLTLTQLETNKQKHVCR